MIEISFGKLLLLAVVALIVLGPEKLPGAARTAGALLRRMRSGWDSVRAEVEREIQAEEIKRTLRETADAARATHDSVRDDIRGTTDRVRDSFTDSQIARHTAPDAVPDPQQHMLPLNAPAQAEPSVDPEPRNDPHGRS
ncbi:sec-independent protein translocase protein TatB [Luteibacter rhizovicinus]|uniref:Sec-independent protein translocase protein TatB n=1 Tax=Luteibacter rhizovicinus TaxID=242606 RepID=A0A4R3YWA2_9GAMM|nr:Sec-independent protein translocase protein TatB [Luteibacter rhizovicinus]TCV96098.1 sec-independent protein translocase protein TatB [Luteibacter rhizovicinus]